jgi:indole-3-glycerol phosphate synthase
MNKPILIAEVKTRSPFGFQSDKSWGELFELANAHGDWLSIHTDPRWGGSFSDIKKARTKTTKPILAKGIHRTDEDIEKALAAGADYVLVVGRVPKIHASKLIIEPHTIAQLKALNEQHKAAWNARDLKTGQAKDEEFAEARSAFSGWLCQASFIQTKDDIHPQADGVLVGESLEGLIASFDRI